GLGVPLDYAKAREWYEKAAAKDHAQAMYNLGMLFANGQGVVQDLTKTHELYGKAAAKDEAAAMNGLGTLYHDGEGVTQDHAKAHEWYGKAAAKDYADAMANLGVLFANGLGVPVDYAKARDWLEKAAAKGDARAKMYLGLLPVREAFTAGRYAEALQRQEALAAKVEAWETKLGGKPGKETAQRFLSVTWYALLAREFTKVCTVSERPHGLFPDNISIESNRAHALMFMERGEEAKALYLAHKGEPVSPQNRLWEQVIAENFAEFRKAGLTHPMMVDIEKELGVSP